MIRGAVYRVDLGDAKRGHETATTAPRAGDQPDLYTMSVATIIPTSTTAQPAVFRPALEINGQVTRFLVDQIRSIDTTHIHGDPVHCLDHDELSEIERAVVHYLGL